MTHTNSHRKVFNKVIIHIYFEIKLKKRSRNFKKKRRNQKLNSHSSLTSWKGIHQSPQSSTLKFMIQVRSRDTCLWFITLHHLVQREKKINKANFLSFFFLGCNRTYYGEAGKTYDLELHRPKEDKIPFICHLTFAASGNEFGDLIQVNDHRI